MRQLIRLSAFAATCVAASLALAQSKGATTVSDSLPDYKAVEGVSGTIKSIGSDTMNNVMAHWGESFKKFYPGTTLQVEGKGSSTAPPALIEGQAQFGPMSREMKKSEIDEFEKKFGYKPTGLRTAIDCLAIYVHKDCPLNEITMEQAMKVFSVAGPEMTWDQLGVKDEAYKGKPVSLYGRNSASGTYGYFKEHVLQKKDFKSNVKEQPGSSGVVQGIASDKFGMGYSGIGYKTADVKFLKVADKGGKAVAPSADTAYSGEYPIARFLWVYTNFDAKKPMDPLRGEFVKLIFSKAGQEGVVKDGFIPVTPEIAREELVKVGLGK
ncbi:MAG: PstS family phosphate ABC transporter substrate-binding protein [Planctomycetes bacterium]|nr:PstS family phosphate ABC transporter substrate-binding protein [Planctomycetota bacterium]